VAIPPPTRTRARTITPRRSGNIQSTSGQLVNPRSVVDSTTWSNNSSPMRRHRNIHILINIPHRSSSFGPVVGKIPERQKPNIYLHGYRRSKYSQCPTTITTYVTTSWLSLMKDQHHFNDVLPTYRNTNVQGSVHYVCVCVCVCVCSSLQRSSTLQQRVGDQKHHSNCVKQ